MFISTLYIHLTYASHLFVGGLMSYFCFFVIVVYSGVQYVGTMAGVLQGAGTANLSRVPEFTPPPFCEVRVARLF